MNKQREAVKKQIEYIRDDLNNKGYSTWGRAVELILRVSELAVEESEAPYINWEFIYLEELIAKLPDNRRRVSMTQADEIIARLFQVRDERRGRGDAVFEEKHRQQKDPEWPKPHTVPDPPGTSDGEFLRKVLDNSDQIAHHVRKELEKEQNELGLISVSTARIEAAIRDWAVREAW